MAYRAKVRNPDWQQKMLRQARASCAACSAATSAGAAPAASATTPTFTPTCNRSATDDFLREHGYATFIHGHTHRPATHDHIVDGIHVERWVLADWHEDRGECLVWDGEALSREAILPENRP